MNNDVKVQRSILLPLREKRDFFSVYLDQGESGSIIVPPESRVAINETTDVEVVFTSEKVLFHTRGVARWKRKQASPGYPAGIDIELLPSEIFTRDLMVKFARGLTSDVLPRNRRRYSVCLTVDYKLGGAVMTGVTENISRNGALIRASALPNIGEEIHLKLNTPTTTEAMVLKAQVRWLQPDESPAFGVRFIFASQVEEKQLQALVSWVKKKILDL